MTDQPTPDRRDRYAAAIRDNEEAFEPCPACAAVPVQPAAADKETVGYSGKGRVFCVACPRPDGEDVPLTVDDVDHWDQCPSCGRYVVEVAQAQQTEVTHSCRNCEGIDPGSCLMNPKQPKRPMDPVHILGLYADTSEDPT